MCTLKLTVFTTPVLHCPFTTQYLHTAILVRLIFSNSSSLYISSLYNLFSKRLTNNLSFKNHGNTYKDNGIRC